MGPSTGWWVAGSLDEHGVVSIAYGKRIDGECTNPHTVYRFFVIPPVLVTHLECPGGYDYESSAATDHRCTFINRIYPLTPEKTTP